MLRLVVLVMLMVLGACGGPTVRTDVAPDFEPASIERLAVIKPPGDAAEAAINPLKLQRLREQAERDFAAKGYEIVPPDQAQARVQVVADWRGGGSRSRGGVGFGVGFGAGHHTRTGFGLGTSTAARDDEFILAVHLLRGEEIVWRGVSDRYSSDDEGPSDERLAEMLEAILAKLPDRHLPTVTPAE